MSANTVTIDNPGKRVAKVSKLLRKLRSDDRVVAVGIVGIKRDFEMIEAAFENRRLSSHRESFFKTSSPNIWANYWEAWRSDDGASPWRLSVASLQLVWVDGPEWNPREIVAMHCEPNEVGKSFQSQLKRGPHIHVKADGNRLGHAHFPLNLCHLNDVMHSIESLEHAIETAIDVLRSEVIDRL
jgi:hypothetical protein